MNGKRWAAIFLVGFLNGWGYPFHQPWERAFMALAVAILCLLVVVGPARAT